MVGKYSLDDVIDVADARAAVLERVAPVPAERVAAPLSIGRVLAQDVVSDADIPPFDSSAMDGFAVRSGDFADGASGHPAALDVIGVLGAGAVFDRAVEPGQTLRIMCGAPLPAGADAVVRIEDTRVPGGSGDSSLGAAIIVSKPPVEGENVRRAGRVARRDDVVLRCGDPMTMSGVELLATTGNSEVWVYGRPRVAVISSGSELVEMTEVPAPGQIRNSNTPSLAAAIIDAGGSPVLLPPVEDSYEAVAAALLGAVKDHDLVVISGGAAEGDFDFTARVVRELGELFFSKVALHPGTSQTFGAIDATPLFGLPGNPGAAALGFELLVRPAIRKMQGFGELSRPVSQAFVTKAIAGGEGRRRYLHAHIERTENGSLMVTPCGRRSSVPVSARGAANCLLIVPGDSGPVEVGAVVDCLRVDLPEGAVV
jgi:molybdopterin molybdotransferase